MTMPVEGVNADPFTPRVRQLLLEPEEALVSRDLGPPSPSQCGQNRNHARQQTVSLFDNLGGTGEQRRR